MTNNPHLTILFDNNPGAPGLTSLWGFAALIRAAGRNILFGGFHLMYADAAAIAASIRALQGLGVDYVVPTHCTGDAATEAFQVAYGAGCIGAAWAAGST